MLRFVVPFLIVQAMTKGVTAKVTTVHSATFHGITDTLKPEDEQYAGALESAAEAFQEAETIFDDPGFEKRKGWSKESDMDGGGTVHSKYVDNGKMIVASTTLEGNVDDIMHDIWTGLPTQPSWDSNMDFAGVVVTLTNYSDIMTYGSNQILIVSGREIVAARMYRPLPNGGYRQAFKSISIPSKPETDERIRAQVYLAAYQFRPHPDHPADRTLYDMISLINLRGSLPGFMVNGVLPKIMALDTDHKVAHFKELAKKAPSHAQ